MRFSSVRAKKCLSAFLLSVFTLISTLQVDAENYPLPEMDPNGFPAPNVGCLAGKCHGGIEPIRAQNSGRAKQI